VHAEDVADVEGRPQSTRESSNGGGDATDEEAPEADSRLERIGCGGGRSGAPGSERPSEEAAYGTFASPRTLS
jgi:hypothetical protein